MYNRLFLASVVYIYTHRELRRTVFRTLRLGCLGKNRHLEMKYEKVKWY